MMLQDIELHDSLLIDMAIDYGKKSVRIGIEYYETAESKKRTAASILFENVESISQISNFDALEKNAFAGHVIQYVPGAKHQSTYIDTVGGCIVVIAEKISFNKDSPRP